LYQLITLICTEYRTTIGSPIQMRGRICTGRDTRYKCEHLYRVVRFLGTNVLPHTYLYPLLSFLFLLLSFCLFYSSIFLLLPGMPHLYRVGIRPVTNVATFVPGLARTQYKCGHTGSLGGLFSPPGTNALICTGGKNTRYK
jgi:hypothetical protein